PAAGRRGAFVHTKGQHLLRATMLLDAAASMTIRDLLLKLTPLGWACRRGRVATVRRDLPRRVGAVDARGEPWGMPVACAEKPGHPEMIELLRLHGAGT